MGMPSSETLLEELMYRVLGVFLQEEYLQECGDTPQELISNWLRILETLNRCNLQLSATKTVI